MECQRLVLVPSNLPPHKATSADLAAAADRVEMCRLAVKGADFFQVDEIELARNVPSYTLETARQIARNNPSAGPVQWLIGADTLPQLPTWHQFDQLLREVKFLIMARPDSLIDWGRLPPALQALRGQVVQAPADRHQCNTHSPACR